MQERILARKIAQATVVRWESELKSKCEEAGNDGDGMGDKYYEYIS